MATPQGLSFYANGVNIARDLDSFQPTAEAEPIDVTSLNDTYRVYEQSFKSGMLEVSGFLHYNATNLNRVHDLMSAAFNDRSEVIITTSLVSLAIGGDAIILNGTVGNYSIATPLADKISVGLEIISNNAINFGKWLFNAAVNNTTTNGTSVDNGAATTNGGIVHAHMQNGSGNDVNVIVQHSSNGSTWVDLVEVDIIASGDYGTISAVVAKGTTVNRYLRAVATTTGGSDTVQVAFARR